MEDIKVGEYVRTKTGYIAKVRNIICKGYPIKSLEGYIICDDEDGTILNPEEVKHSFNLIDLIEVGDYVNGRLVLAVDYKRQNICLLIPLTDTKANTNIMWYGYEEIKTILTHELYEANAYKAKGE